MVTGTLTIVPPIIVLQNGGKISLRELEKKCLEIDSIRFNGVDIKKAIKTYSACLIEKDGVVRFDTTAVKYARYGMMEREMQVILHGVIPDMEKWQLYPLKTRKNSPVCNLGAPWKIIPKDNSEEEYNDLCDFREEGTDGCRLGCGVDEKYFK